MSILFCTPMYGGNCTREYFESCMNLKEDLNRAGIEHDWLTGKNESLVHRARMEQARAFLASDYKRMMTLDADIEYKAEEIAKLWNMDADIAVGAYCMKRPDMPLSAWKNGKLVRLEDCPKEPFEVDYAGTGFFMVKREVVEAIADYLVQWEKRAKDFVERLAPTLCDADQKTLHRMLGGMAATYEGPDGRVPAIFMTPIHNGCLESEDYHFCRIAREAGFKVVMDPSVRLGHWGSYRYAA